MAKKAKAPGGKSVEALRHEEAKRRNIPTAEYHDQNWSNRMILGDSLQVMASLAEREGLRGKVQCIYIDPPYGIKFNSNFQWSTTSRDVKHGNAAHITREPEQVKAFRDTWRDGIHSYLTYLWDRLTVARDLLVDQDRSLSRSAMRLCIESGCQWMKCPARTALSLSSTSSTTTKPVHRHRHRFCASASEPDRRIFWTQPRDI